MYIAVVQTQSPLQELRNVRVCNADSQRHSIFFFFIFDHLTFHYRNATLVTLLFQTSIRHCVLLCALGEGLL